MKFWSNGSKPPPTTIIINIPEAGSVYFPRPSVARLKIHGHITLVHSPQSTSNNAETGTTTILKAEPVNTGIETAALLPNTIAVVMSIIARMVVHDINVLLEILLAMKPAMKRPMSIKNQ